MSPKEKVFDYVIRTEFDCVLDGDVFFTPFEIFNLYLSITVQSILLNPNLNEGKNIQIKFNCMNSDQVDIVKASDSLEYGSYTLANYFLDSDVTDTSKHRF